MTLVDKLLAGCCIFVLGVAGFIGYHAVFVSSDGQTKGVTIKPTPRIVYGQKSEGTSGGTSKVILDKDKKLYDQLENDPKATKFQLTDVIGSNTYGKGAYYRGGGKLYIGMELNMPSPPEGHVHQVWLMKELPRKQFVPMGRPQILGEGKYLSAKTITPDYPEFTKIIVTLEATEDMTPERVVMQGDIP
jgi:hypothetical protein